MKCFDDQPSKAELSHVFAQLDADDGSEDDDDEEVGAKDIVDVYG